MGSGDELVLAGVEDGIAGILLNRPDTQNAWSVELADAYHAALDAAAANDDVRVVVVTGAGDAFCTTELRPPPPSSKGRRSPLHPMGIGKPIIAAINGPCSGMGLSEALVCDVRFAAESATLAAPYARRGQVLPEALAWLLPRIVGLGPALDIVLSGEELTADDALVAGIVKAVHPDHELTQRVLDYAGDLVARTVPHSVAAIKAQVYRAMEMGLAQAIDDARLLAERLG